MVVLGVGLESHSIRCREEPITDDVLIALGFKLDLKGSFISCRKKDRLMFLSATIADIEMLGGVTASVCSSHTFDYVPEVRSSRNW